MRILFVDDDENLLKGIFRRLRSRFSIEMALSGEEALEKVAREGPYAVVVSDYKMGGMHGLDFLAQVRAHSPDTVRIMLSGQCDPGAAKDALTSKLIFRYLAKPCDCERIATCLDEALEVNEWLTHFAANVPGQLPAN